MGNLAENSADGSGTAAVRVTFKDGAAKDVPACTTLLELSQAFKSVYGWRIVAAKVNNDIKELTYEITKDCTVEFIDLSHDDGQRIYRRSLRFLLIKAVHDIYPDRKVVINHSISKGIYCEIKGDTNIGGMGDADGVCSIDDMGGPALTADETQQIEKKMHEIVKAALPFTKTIIPIEEAREIVKKKGRFDLYHVVEHRTKPYFTIYRCEDIDDYFYGYMVPDTGYLEYFKLIFYPPGIIMLFPEKSNPTVVPEFKEQKKLFNIFLEYKNWGQILDVGNVGAVNDVVASGGINDLVLISEGLHEKKIAQIADMVVKEPGAKRVVLISGPSSSGKTTFARRLEIQLRVNGVKPFTLSIDDFFFDRDKTPKDEKGEFDYEAVEAIDIPLFNKVIAGLLSGDDLEIPVFDFLKGRRSDKCRKAKIEQGQIIIIEGIHGLNDELTHMIPKELKFKIYVSALTSMNIDDHNRVPTTDTRLIRRIVRDNKFRSNGALETIKRWPSVRRGEEIHVFPYQESADVMFNSALVYEHGVLKDYAMPLLEKIDKSYPEHSEAKRLIEFLNYFLPISTQNIPPNSIIKEFIGE